MGVQIIMDRSGDTRHTFDASDPDSVVRADEELPRPLLKYAWQALLVEQPTLPELGLQYCFSSCA